MLQLATIATLFIFTSVDLPAPANVKATPLSSNSIEVTWDQAPGATGYTITYATKTTDGDQSRVIKRRHSCLSHILTDLEYDTDYTITVQGTTNDDDNEGAKSGQTSVKTHKHGK